MTQGWADETVKAWLETQFEGDGTTGGLRSFPSSDRQLARD